MKLKKVLFWPDTHTPFHDPKCVKVALEIAKDFRPDEIVFLGDFFDCYSVSRYDKDPAKTYQSLSEELSQGQQLLAQIESIVRPKSLVFLEGNHEARIPKYLKTYASVLSDLKPTREILGLPKSWKYLPYGQENHYRCGNLIVTHGSICSKHVAHAMVSKYGKSVLFGHTHKIQEYQIKTITGESHRGINIGWLGDSKRAAEYVNNIADWSHGLAVGYFMPNGKFWTQIIHIIDGQAVFGGKLYG